MTLAERLFEAASEAKLTISTAESCTGGMVAAAITDVPGSSAIFEQGVVTYSNAAKQALLGVSEETLATHGAVSEAVAREMAMGTRAKSGASLGIAVSGIAGPGGSDHKPEGRVCFAVASGTGCIAETVEFGARGRTNVRAAARDHALTMLIAAIPEVPRP